MRLLETCQSSKKAVSFDAHGSSYLMVISFKEQTHSAQVGRLSHRTVSRRSLTCFFAHTTLHHGKLQCPLARRRHSRPVYKESICVPARCGNKNSNY